MADTSNSWEIASTVMTAIASCVALGVPFILDSLQRKSRRDETRQATLGGIREIVRAVEELLSVFWASHDYLGDILSGDISETDLREFAQRSRRASDVITLLMKRPDLTDGVIRCGVDAVALGQETASILMEAPRVGFSSHVEASRALSKDTQRAERIRAQVDRLKSYHKLETPA